MRIWRTVHRDHAEDPFHAPRLSHRWTSPKSHVTYAALDSALAVLEKVAMVRRADQLEPYLLIEAEYTGSVEEAKSLPAGWDAFPHPKETQTVGDAWFAAGRTGALVVPSALVPARNIVLNREHGDFSRLTVKGRHRLKGMAR